MPQHTDNSTTRPGPLQCAQTFPGWLVACVATILEAVHDMRTRVCAAGLLVLISADDNEKGKSEMGGLVPGLDHLK